MKLLVQTWFDRTEVDIPIILVLKATPKNQRIANKI